MFAKKLASASFNLSLLFGTTSALACFGAAYRFRLMVFALVLGLIGFGLFCLHIVTGQREESDIKLASTPMLLLSLILNSSPILFMVMLAWMVKHGK